MTSPLLVCGTFPDSVKRNRSLNFILSSLKREEPTAKTNSSGKLAFFCVALSSVKSAWERTPQPLVRMPEVSFGNALPKLKSSLFIQSKNPEQGSQKGGNPALLGFLYQFQELSFSHCQKHPSIPIVTSPRLSNWSKREAGTLQREARGSVTQALGTHAVCLKHSHSISPLPWIPRLPDGSLPSPFSVLLRQ